MTIVQAAYPEHWGWLVSRAGCKPTDGFRAVEAIDGRTGRILGMVGYDGWTANSVVMSIALDNPLALRKLLRPAFEYAFVQSGKGVALCTVRARNTASLRLCKKVGFRETHRVKDGIEVGEDLVLFEMRREECVYLTPGSPIRRVA